jgi:hypothetical protein
MALKYLMCVAGGVALGYAYAYSRAEREFQERLDRESEELRYYYRDKYMKKAAEREKNAPKAEDAVEMMRQTYEGGSSVVTEVVASELSQVAKKGVVRGDISAIPEEDENFVGDDRVAEAVRKKGLESNGQVDALIAEGGLVEKAAKPPVVNYNRISTPEKADIPEQSRTEETSSSEEDAVEIEEITRAAFVADEFSYKQFSFTYYAGDDVLANEEDEPVTGAAREVSIGAEALRKLKVGREAMGGEGEIYVRNRTGGWEFAIVRSDGKFSEEVRAEMG